jgi:hypothetical protein|tara:strand:+ start:1247 stop:1873 length:627 start_codon:yes stop_codon:yes gene_type:complete
MKSKEIISADYDIKILDVKLLKRFSNNPRKTNQTAIDEVKKSIEQNQFSSVIVVDKNYEIIAGHTRYAAALQLGIKELPVFVAKNLDDSAVKRLRVIDNRLTELTPWDLEKLTDEMGTLEVDEDFKNLFEFISDPDFSTFDEPEEEIKPEAKEQPAANFQYVMTFDNELQRARWHEFLYGLSEHYSEDEYPTHAARLDAYITGLQNER